MEEVFGTVQEEKIVQVDVQSVVTPITQRLMERLTVLRVNVNMWWLCQVNIFILFLIVFFHISDKIYCYLFIDKDIVRYHLYFWSIKTVNLKLYCFFLQDVSSTGTDRSTCGWRIATMRDLECSTPEQSQSRSEMAELIQVSSGNFSQLSTGQTKKLLNCSDQSRSHGHCLEFVLG